MYTVHTHTLMIDYQHIWFVRDIVAGDHLLRRSVLKCLIKLELLGIRGVAH